MLPSHPEDLKEPKGNLDMKYQIIESYSYDVLKFIEAETKDDARKKAAELPGRRKDDDFCENISIFKMED